MAKKHLIFIESNLTNGLLFWEELKRERDIRITFLTSNLRFYQQGNPEADRFLSICDQILEVPDTTNVPEVCRLLENVQKKQPFHGIITFFDLHVPTVALIAKHFHLPHLNPHAAALARSKGEMRIVCGQAGVLQPKFAMPQTFETARQAADLIGYPVIVKPSDGSASLNMALARNPEELERAVGAIHQFKTYGGGLRASRQALIEEYIEGSLVSVECLTVGGKHIVLGVTDRILGEPPCFAELGGSFPSGIPGQELAVQTALRALDAIGFDLGASHTEVMLSPRGAFLVEINPRLAGGFVADMMKHSLKRNIMSEVVRLALGEEIDLKFETHSVATLLALTTEEEGVLQEIFPCTQYDEKQILRYFFSKKIGDSVRPPRNNYDRLGYVVATGKDPQESYSRAESIRQATGFKIV